MDTQKQEEVKRIAIVGPECTGKTDLSRFLAGYYQTAWVPEFARTYLDQLDHPYEKTDLLKIADGQLALENALALQANKLLFCDTNLIVIKIWSEFKYNTCDPEIIRKMQPQKYDLHLLTYIDIPWTEDPLREHPDKREVLYELYRAELIRNKVNFVEIKGLEQTRKEVAIQAIDKVLRESYSHSG